MQVGSVQREARPDGRPQLGDVDLEQQSATLIAEALPRDRDGSRGDLRLEAEHAQRARGVAGQIQPAPVGRHTGSRSISSGERPTRASIGASARPAMPPPAISTRRPPITSPAAAAMRAGHALAHLARDHARRALGLDADVADLLGHRHEALTPRPSAASRPPTARGAAQAMAPTAATTVTRLAELMRGDWALGRRLGRHLARGSGTAAALSQTRRR